MAKPALRIDMTVKANRLPAIGTRARQQIGQAVRAAAFRAVATAKVHAPIDIGHHKANIGYEPGKDDLHATVKAGAGYALYLERGTRRMAARPHVEPAVRAEVAHLERDVAEAMRP